LTKKPIGEISKNYKLFTVTGWDGEIYRRIEACLSVSATLRNAHPEQSGINELIEEHLNTTFTYSQQDRSSLNAILRKVCHPISLSGSIVDHLLLEAAESFPCLKSFDNGWVTLNFIKMELRRTVAQHRKKKA
jgi:hypothetical protein